MPHPVLNEDWSDYDDRKNKGGQDRSKVACTESWERDYIVRKLKKHYPKKSESEILQAVESCCKSISAPRPRDKFMDCVDSKLKG
ncbi:hypothetical protein [Filimonas effusa]|uniref:Uncharacterized protein n=1 Tax=Filimonas effusa TaxID=2508721 RepID=A0A4Q1D6W3_9BACT|nr:hypothetical protein [Filimonas effusa]RXK83653.1 hypothetical protein ESB13_16355 [Filimonas effusa]